ncbi:hypothetical protein IW262DRAFT_1461546 [Armillaria fumosa]|nr:hypothetical protein IW262DRAFT_1461546 [Armillaria fumosa]
MERVLSYLQGKYFRSGASPDQSLPTSINTDFLRGTLTSIVESSGSGKTTLLNVLSEQMRGSNLFVQGQRIHNNSTWPSTKASAKLKEHVGDTGEWFLEFSEFKSRKDISTVSRTSWCPGSRVGKRQLPAIAGLQ